MSYRGNGVESSGRAFEIQSHSKRDKVRKRLTYEEAQEVLMAGTPLEKKSTGCCRGYRVAKKLYSGGKRGYGRV